MGTHVSIHGRALGFDSDTKALYSQGRQISPVAAFATITTVDTSTTVTTSTIQLRDANGVAVSGVHYVWAEVYADEARAALATTGGSTGIAASTGAIATTITAKKAFYLVSNGSGVIVLTYTDTAQEASWLGLRLPTGVYVMANITTSG